MKTTDILLIITGLFVSLMAGLFYAYSCSVVPGLGKLGDAEYLRSMQSINREIQNPVFFLCFFGALILLPIALYLNFGQPVSPRFTWLAAATVAYGIGVFGVTVFGNVPLNEALDKFDIARATAETIRAERQLFESKWNFLNHIRSLASAASVVFMLLALLNKNR
jgi:uncharacterized membrane protein